MQLTDSQRWMFICVLAVTGGLVYLLQPILSPFMVAALLAYMFDPLADRLEDKGMSRTGAVIIVFGIISALVMFLLLLLLPKLGHQIQVMVKTIPAVITLFETKVVPWMEVNLGISLASFDWQSVRQILSGNWQQTGNVLKDVMNSIGQSGMAVAAWLANLVLIPVVMFYLLRDWDVMIEKIGHLLPRNVEPRVSLWASECDEVLGAFVKGQLLVMTALGAIYAIGLWLVGLDLALLVGMIAGLASIVPYMGFIIGIVAAIIAAMLQFNDPTVLAWVGLVFIIGQMLEGMVLTPLLVGDRIGLHPVAVIFAIMAGGQLFGFVGILIALPVAAVIMVLLRHLHDGYQRSSLYGEAKTAEAPPGDTESVTDSQKDLAGD
ncbi:AI-2E family transporter [Aliamphritea spongicola]|uniref:AI-2E family transporter n=1 Tax=Aliamphritea spongicola TaxID=707589 RepID=UPI00196AD579|nr:AI-2E family transporter [Aliamphritea spongicola]MBN3560678.1 AI-2E family transporter [Aliamphritea spongicola]